MNDVEAVKAEIKQRFAHLALAPQEEKKFPVGPASARNLGYDASEIDALPKPVTESFCGVGNPLSLGELKPGQTVLDVGCGAGMDSILAARRVGAGGKVISVDFVLEMIKKTRRNAELAGVKNVEECCADASDMPVPDSSVDVVISNGVFNLCLNKPKVISEIFRVLRPGGRLQMADILLGDEVTSAEVERLGTWSD